MSIRNRCLLAFHPVLLLAVLGIPTVARGQNPRVECLAPIQAGCTITVDPGPAKVPINIKVISAGADPIDNATVSFTASACCIEPPTRQQMKTDPTGIASAIWSGNVPENPNTPIRVYIWGSTDGRVFRDSVVVNPKTDSTVYQITSMDPRHIWFRDDQIPHPIMFKIDHANEAMHITENECDRIQVAFTPHLGGSAGPSPAHARWDRATRTCTVGAQWKLANTVGVQHLHANLVGTAGPKRVDTNATAISRHPPRFIAGFGVLLEDEENENRVRGVFGVDFPFFHQRTCLLDLCERLRFVLGSSFEDPQEDYYAGVVLIPLFLGPSREGIPIQLSANYANGGTIFGALSVDATSLLNLAIESLAK